MSNFLQRQGSLILKNKSYAYFLTALLALLPFANWLSLSVIALVTLRKGSFEGSKILLIGLCTAMIINSHSHILPFELPALLATFVFCFLGALALRASASWKMLIAAMVTVGLGLIALIHWLAPSSILLEFDALLGLFQKVLPDGSWFQSIDVTSPANRQVLANYLLGIQMLSILISALSSLMLARHIQALLYHPGGFREELLAFKATRIGVFVLIICCIATYQHYAMALSFLPLLLVYVMAAGMVVLFKILLREKDWLALLFICLPLILVPYIMLPIYVLFGSLDSWFNFTRFLSSKAEKPQT